MPLAPQPLPGALTRSLGRMLRSRMVERKTTLAEACQVIGVSEGQLSKMLHGQRRMDVEQLDQLCTFLDLDAADTLRGAKSGASTAVAASSPAAAASTNTNVRELSRRLRFVRGLHGDDEGSYRAASRAAGRIGVALSLNTWNDLVDGAVSGVPEQEVLTAVSIALGADPQYLATGDTDFVQRAEAEADLESAMRRSGTMRIAARNLASLHVSEIRAITALVRRGGSGD